tara:strand:- start:25 stop:747 length:723 start_codon:yes stop_codon:yes gene_type:complete
VNVIIKGTQTGTQTDFDGNFKISVPDSLNILSFSFLGFQPLEYELETQENIEIFLKDDCNIDWFDEQLIGFYLNSGFVNNPIGGQFKISFTPNYNWPTIKTGISYQTNLKENRFLNAYLNFHHLFVSCDFNVDINSSYKNLDYENNIELSAYSVETSLNFNTISTIIGLSTMDFNKTSVNKNFKSVGPTFGLGTWIGQTFLMSVSAKTTIYKNLSEYHAEIKKDYKGFYGFLKYYKPEFD